MGPRWWAMVVGVCRLILHIPHAASLKDKRRVLRRVVDRVAAKFNTSIAEVDELNDARRAALGFAVVSNDSRHANSMIDKITGFIESLAVAQLGARDFELLHYGAGEFGDRCAEISA